MFKDVQITVTATEYLDLTKKKNETKEKISSTDENDRQILYLIKRLDLCLHWQHDQYWVTQILNISKDSSSTNVNYH